MASLIQEELGTLLLRDLGVPGALITITKVEVSPDLLQAKVSLGIIPYEKGLEAFTEIEKIRPQLQHKLLKKLNIRPMPTLKFEIEENK